MHTRVSMCACVCLCLSVTLSCGRVLYGQSCPTPNVCACTKCVCLCLWVCVCETCNWAFWRSASLCSYSPLLVVVGFFSTYIFFLLVFQNGLPVLLLLSAGRSKGEILINQHKWKAALRYWNGHFACVVIHRCAPVPLVFPFLIPPVFLFWISAKAISSVGRLRQLSCLLLWHLSRCHWADTDVRLCRD